jgi:transposase
MPSEEESPMPRRTFTRDFKESAAKLVTEQGYSLKKAAEGLGVDRASIAHWVQLFAPPPTPAASAEADLRRENERLRAENKRLLMEREILKKATAFFAREQP